MSTQVEAAIKEFLTVNQWPAGYQEEYLITNARQTHSTYWIVDDSGSMCINDAVRFVKSGVKLVPVPCSRYTELQETITFHASLAHSAKTQTTFRLLNNAAPIIIGGPRDDGSAYGRLMQAMELPPSGGTPLCGHLSQIIAEITALAPQLRAEGKRVKVVIATDGEASDGNLAVAMRPLKDLPVWLVLRLCTNEDKVISYYNKVEADIEMSMEVVKNLNTECDEVTELNPWLFYTEPLHRLRESGCNRHEVDLLNEGKLNASQIRDFCILIFGSAYKDMPHPDVDWKAFMKAVQAADDASVHSWSPIAKAVSYHIDKKQLSRHLNKPECCIM